MAFGDPIYQLNDALARIKVLENLAKASNPGNLPSLGPNHPLAVVTSSGQSTAGADSDNFSRAISTAVQQSLSSVESLEDTKVTASLLNFGAGTTISVASTNYIRPDPIVGDIFRMTLGGGYVNSTGGNQTVQFTFRISGGAQRDLGTVLIGDGETRLYLLNLTWGCTAAGPSGAISLLSRLTASIAVVGLAATPVSQDLIQARFGFLDNLVAPVPEILAIGSVASASLQVQNVVYTLERVGTASVNRV